MLHIAICDDEQVCLNEIKTLLLSFMQQKDIETEVSAFSHPFELSAAFEKGQLFEIYLLDVYMPGMTGITLAQELRSRGIRSPIIFFTSSADHALEAFGVGAVQYLMKPLQRQAFFAAMETALEKVGSGRRRQLIFKSGGYYHAVEPHEILFSEAKGNYENLHLQNGDILPVRMTAGELYEQLAPAGCFIRCGASYILNLAHARRLNPKFVLMADGSEVPIPRGAFPELKTRYFEFFSRWEG